MFYRECSLYARRSTAYVITCVDEPTDEFLNSCCSYSCRRTLSLRRKSVLCKRKRNALHGDNQTTSTELHYASFKCDRRDDKILIRRRRDYTHIILHKILLPGYLVIAGLTLHVRTIVSNYRIVIANWRDDVPD